jgi:hypothetical protein
VYAFPSPQNYSSVCPYHLESTRNDRSFRTGFIEFSLLLISLLSTCLRGSYISKYVKVIAFLYVANYVYFWSCHDLFAEFVHVIFIYIVSSVLLLDKILYSPLMILLR